MRVERHRYSVDGWGVGEVWVAGGVLVAHELPVRITPDDDLPASTGERDGGPARVDPHPAAPPMGGASSPENTLAENPSRVGDVFVPELRRRIERHLAGEESDYSDLPLELGWCTGFQRALLDTLRDVPWGEVVSYGELAALAGRPGAARAAGSFCAGNRFALVVPCHRVVAANGIGGYGSAGVGYKRQLLALEGVVL